jgi:hypothetical protein
MHILDQAWAGGMLGRKKVHCCTAHKPELVQAFDSTLGYPGEGPTELSIVSLNVTGYLNVKGPKHVVICLQETKHSNMHSASLQNTASGLGFNPACGKGEA